jgi:hypothetical protein
MTKRPIGRPKTLWEGDFGIYKDYECKQLEKKSHRMDIDGRR